MRSRHLGGLMLIFGGGLSLLTIYVGTFLTGQWSVEMLLFGSPAPILLTFGLGYTAFWIRRNAIQEKYVLRLAAWFLLGVVLQAIAGASTITYQAFQGVVLTDQFYLYANYATGGGFLGLVIGLYDTQRQRREGRLTEEQERVTQLSQRLTVLNRVLRHDIRNGMNIIEGYIEQIRTQPMQSEEKFDVVRDRAQEIMALSHRARHIESIIGRETTPDNRLDVGAATRRIAERFKDEYPDAEILTEPPDESLYVETQAVEVALREAVENAIIHNSDSNPEVTISARSAEKGRAAAIRVADNGPGLPEDEQAVIDKGRESPLEHSSGLGLWLIKWVIDDAGGRIDINANESPGTHLEFTVPTQTQSRPK